MKTTEEKAKRYDEALEWMREVYPTLTGAAKEDAEHYFPELKESEDETHRKWILEYLYDGLRKSDEQFKGQFKSAIAWLEKQKESPKSADSIPSDCVSDAKCENLHNEEGDFVFELRQIISSHRYSDIYGEYINDEEAMASEILELCKCELEKQKEQKPITINQDEKEFLADEITAFLCNYDKEFDGEDPVPSEVAEHFYLLGKQAQKQKPVEWSEEDERMLLSIINAFRNGAVSTIGQEQWLKSLPERFNLQPKQEWSKEDRDRVAQYLHDRDGGMLWSKATEITSDILDILRPQPYIVFIKDAIKFGNLEYERGVKDGIQHAKNHHWKPSEKQMGALSETIEFAPDTFKPKCTLVTLQDDLKKLMEE